MANPTETATQSGASHPICSAISSPAVFLPSTKYGLMPELRLYQPHFSHASWHNWNACS